MYKIGYDLRYVSKKIRGIPRYNYNLMVKLLEVKNLPFEVICFVDKDYTPMQGINTRIIRIPNPIGIDFENAEVKQEYTTQYNIYNLLEENKIDLYWGTTMCLPFKYRGKSIVNIFDLSFEVNPKWYTQFNYDYYTKYIRSSAYYADRIYACSQNTINDLSNIWNINKDKCKVIYPGIARTFESYTTYKQLYPDYILMVGNLHPRKNYINAINAFNKFKDITRNNCKLVIIGHISFNCNNIINLIQKSKSVIYYNYVSDEVLYNLYKGCKFVLYPSLYEGFGFPVLESQYFDKPVITSNNSSLKEISNNSTYLIDPYSIEDITKGITTLYNDESLRNDLILKGKENWKKYNWETAIDTIIKDIDYLLGGKIYNIKMQKSINIVSDRSWVTGTLAEYIANHTISFKCNLDTFEPNSLLHLFIWTLYKPEYKDNFILTLHHLDNEWSGYDINKALEIIKKAKYIGTPCKDAYNFITQYISKDRVFLIPNGININKYSTGHSLRSTLNIPDSKFLIGTFGTWHQRKGILPLVQAFIQALPNHPDWHLLLLRGKHDGKSREIAQKIKEITSNYQDSISFIDKDQVSGNNYHNWVNLFYTIDLYCSPSYLEGCGFPVLEAMASHCPVVATQTGMVKDFYNGKNYIPIIAGDIESIISGLEQGQLQSESLKSNGYITIQDYSDTRFAESYNKLYKLYFNPIPILYINPTTKMGGAEYSLYYLLKYLDKSKYTPIVLFPTIGLSGSDNKTDGKLHILLQELGIKVIFLDFPDRPNLPPDLKNETFTNNLLQIIKENDIKLVHSNALITSLYSAYIKSITNLPCITHIRDHIKEEKGAIKYNIANNTAIVAVSNHIKTNVSNYVKNIPIYQVYNGTEFINSTSNSFRNLYHISKSDIVIGYIGMIYPLKGVHILLQSCRNILRTYPNVKLIIVGSSYINKSYDLYYHQLKDRAFEYRIDHYTTFTGYLEDKNSVYPAIDILVQPSVEPDSFPRSVIEGMSYGCCVLGSNIGGIPEALNNPELIFTPNNSYELEQKLINLIQNPSYLQTCKDYCFNYSHQHFSITTHTSNIESIYKELLK